MCTAEGPPYGTGGKALATSERAAPEMKEVLAAIPQRCFERSTARSMAYALFSTALTLGLGAGAYLFLPRCWAAAPLWLAYAVVQGTAATGCWVIAHECGHHAFSDNLWIQDAVGYLMHSALLVPYYAWQRSHAVHHSRCNHLTEGETHVPEPIEQVWTLGLRGAAYGTFSIVMHLGFGWPAYLLWGATGGPARGVSNHFVPFNRKLFPGAWAAKTLLSDVGIAFVLGSLYAWARAEGDWTPALLCYFLPLSVVNMWLVLYTWLQHTDVHIPLLDDSEWTWVKGAFLTVDRPYGAVLDTLHHSIGSTHVAHHVCSKIPHYHAREATDALKAAFPELYLYDPTPIHLALWRVAKYCVGVKRVGRQWVHTTPEGAKLA